MSNEYRKNWPLPDDFLLELGRLSALWESLERALNFSLGKLAGFQEIDDPIPFILTVHSSFPQRVDIFGALCEQHLPRHSHLQEYKDVISKIKTAQTLRNKFVHNTIVQDPKTEKFVLSIGSARQKLKISTTEITPEDIHKACKEVHIAALALHELITKAKYAPVWDRKKEETIP